MFGLLTFIFWLILWVYWLISAVGAKKSVRTGRSWWLWSVVVRLVILVVVLVAIYFYHVAAFGNLFHILSSGASSNVALSVIGTVLCGAGVAFAIWARVYLGRNWGMPMTRREEPELVTSGPYQLVRHPIYSGFLLAVFGTGLVDGSIWFLVMVLAGIYFIYSAGTEERDMMGQFPKEYPQYMKRTKMLVPFIL